MKKLKINVGDIYEDCAYHPVRCTSISEDDISGVSMLDGTAPRSCSLNYCGVMKLSEDYATKMVEAWNRGGYDEFIKIRNKTFENASYIRENYIKIR